jgi:hypothetical protein
MLLQHSVEWHSSNATKEKDKIHLRFNRLKIFREDDNHVRLFRQGILKGEV